MKLFVFDVDGTLVTRTQRLRKMTIESLNKLLDKGHAIAIASGRPFSGIKKYLDLLHDGNKFAICANGASLVKYDGTILYELTIELDLLFKLHEKYLNYIKNYGAGLYCYVKDEIGYLEYTKWVRNEVVANKIKAYNLNKIDINFNNIYKIMFAINCEISSNFKFDQKLYEKYHVVRSSPLFLEIVNKDCDKVYGVRKLVDYLGINKIDVYTFGDSGNDLLMIKEFNGVAMDNALEKVKEVSKIITKSCSEDGVSFALNHLINL